MIATLFVVGPAGSGKSTFTGAFQDWMKNNGYDAISVNLDPGADSIPYSPDVDVRNWVILQDIMDEYVLGPNGAQILASDLIANSIDDIKNEIDSFDTDYVIIDTPGQLELFAFRTSSEFIVERLSEKKGYISFIMDPMVAISPSGYISLLTLSASVFFRFYLPFSNIINKIDLLQKSDLDKLKMWSEDRNILYEDLIAEKGKIQNIFMGEMFKSLEESNYDVRPNFVSSKDLSGFEDVYYKIQLSFAGGEDLEKR